MLKMKKTLILLFTICLLITQAACSQQVDTTDSQQVNTPLPTEAAIAESEDDGLRTTEIFDAEKYKDKLQIRFFSLEADSKAGDSMLITTPDGLNMLIDAGIKKVGSQVIDYLNMLGIEKLDYVVASHFHSDHIGGLVTVVNEFDIGEVMVNEMPYNSSLRKQLDEAISQKNLNVQYLKSGDAFNFGDQVNVEVINPEVDIVVPEGVTPEQSNDFVNNRSIVMRMTYENNSFLFTGDIYYEREKVLLENASEKLDVDVLKVPHHGHDTSSSTEFIKAVSPLVSVITSNSAFSTDRYNKYRDEGSDVYITGIDGNVLVLSDGENISAITEKERTGNFLK